MAYRLYDDFMDAQTGFAGMFKLRTMTVAQIEFRQNLIDNDVAPHKIKQWKIKSKDEVTAAGGTWPADALSQLPDPFVEFINGEENKANMSEFAWEELFKDFATALREMNKNIIKLSLEPTVKDFITKYFPIFDNWSLPNQEQEDLDTLISYIEQFGDVRGILLGLGIFSTPTELTQFISAIKNGEFSADNKYKLQRAIEIVNNFGQNHPYTGILIPSPATSLDTHANRAPQPPVNLNNLATALDAENIVPDNLAQFKGKFAEIYSKIFALPKVKGAFGATSTGASITTYMKEADEIYDFNSQDSENFIDEKIEDQLNPIEKFQKNFKDKRTEHFGRLKRRHDGWPYKNKQAEAIVEAMYKEGFTPQQGLDWIMTNKDKVITCLGSGHESVGRWKWLCEQLELAKKKEKVAFRDALYNGQKLKSVKEEMKINAPKTGAKAKYKVASEILTVIQYEDFSTFNDQEIYKDPWVITSNLSFAKKGTILGGAAQVFDWGVKQGVKHGVRAAKIGVRKINHLIAGATKTKRMSALNKKLETDKSTADTKLAAFGVDAIAADIKAKEAEIDAIKKQIQDIDDSEYGKRLIELETEHKKIEINMNAMYTSIQKKNAEIAAGGLTPIEITRITRQRDSINNQFANYATRYHAAYAFIGAPPALTLTHTNLDAEMATLTARVNAEKGTLPTDLGTEEVNKTVLEGNLEADLNARGFERWEYDHAKYLAENAKNKIDDIAEMNAFDKELDATSRSLNIFQNIKEQRKVWYAQQAAHAA